MENKIKIYAAIFVLFCVGLTYNLLFQSFKNNPKIEEESGDPAIPKPVKVSNHSSVEKAESKSITFILGDDTKADNRYYWEATNYYKTAPEAQTDELVTHCRSLLEVRNYLAEKATPGLPWGLINMVVHSNEWSGMEVSVFPEGNRATVQSVKEAQDGGSFPSLPASVIDENTVIKLYGCALGKNEELLKVLAELFGGKSESGHGLKVESSPYFIFYESSVIDGVPSSRKYQAEAYYAFFKRGYRPGDIRLSRQFQKRYPDLDKDWRSALMHTNPDVDGNLFHYTFNLPVVWTVTYPDKASRPILNTNETREAWLNEQPELLAVIEQLGISKEYFSWTFRNINYTFEDGVTEPGIKVIGFCTVLCVLEMLDNQPDAIARG